MRTLKSTLTAALVLICASAVLASDDSTLTIPAETKWQTSGKTLDEFDLKLVEAAKAIDNSSPEAVAASYLRMARLARSARQEHQLEFEALFLDCLTKAEAPTLSKSLIESAAKSRAERQAVQKAQSAVLPEETYSLKRLEQSDGRVVLQVTVAEKAAKGAAAKCRRLEMECTLQEKSWRINDISGKGTESKDPSSVDWSNAEVLSKDVLLFQLLAVVSAPFPKTDLEPTSPEDASRRALEFYWRAADLSKTLEDKISSQLRSDFIAILTMEAGVEVFTHADDSDIAQQSRHLEWTFHLDKSKPKASVTGKTAVVEYDARQPNSGGYVPNLKLSFVKDDKLWLLDKIETGPWSKPGAGDPAPLLPMSDPLDIGRWR